MKFIRKARFLGKNGKDYDLRHAKRQLEVGKIYTVHRIDIKAWGARLSLVGEPGDFGSAMFEEIEYI